MDRKFTNRSLACFIRQTRNGSDGTLKYRLNDITHLSVPPGRSIHFLLVTATEVAAYSLPFPNGKVYDNADDTIQRGLQREVSFVSRH